MWNHLSHPFRSLTSAMRRLGTKPLEALPNCPDLFQSYRSLTDHPELRRKQGGWEYRGKFYPDYLTVGGASYGAFREALKYCDGRGIDIGAGLWPLPGAIPVDIWRGLGAAQSLEDFAEGSLDYVFSSHCLEHNADWKPVLNQWTSKLKRNGMMFLYLPHPECGIWEPGSPFVGDEHKWTPTPEIIKSTMQDSGFSVVACDDGPDAMYSFWVCARKGV
jgi:SAM-dependent methyltransferase